MRRILPAAVVFIVVAIRVDGQASMDSLAGHFMRYVKSDNTEKVFILTDKAFYGTGETMWLKAWCLASLSNRYIHKSKTLFVDLVDDKDSVINQLVFNLALERTNGKITLPGTLKEGYYWLRGYTSNILREDSNRIFVKPIYLINPGKPNPKALSAYAIRSDAGVEEDTSAPRILFFPEGGSIISGTTATVGFHSLDSKGRPVGVTGYVTDTHNDTVAKFTTLLPGTGKFSFDAYNPRKYFAHIKWQNGRDVIYPLPLIDQFASQLSVVDQTDQVVHVRVSQGDSLYKKHKTTYLLGVSRDSLCFAATGTDMYEVNIQKANFPQGMATLYLFDDKNRMVSQRTVFIDNDTNRIVTATDKSTYSPLEKVNMNIGVAHGPDNQSIKALLAVSVTDNQFAANNPDVPLHHYTADETDLLMLTRQDLYQGWKYGMDSRASALEYEDSDLLSIKGRVTDKKDQPLMGCIVNLFSKSQGTIFLIDTTNTNGRFHFSLPDFDDGAQFNLKLTNLKGQGQDGKVILDKFPFPEFKTPHELKKGFAQSEIATIRRMRERVIDTTTNAVMKPATVQGKTGAASIDPNKRVSPFSYIITPDKYYNDINGLVDAISAAPGFNAGLGSLNGATGSMGVQPLVVLDGVQMTLSGDVKSFLTTLDPTQIEFVELLYGPLTATYGVQGAGGIIMITEVTNGKEITQVTDKGVTTIYPKGYFNQPDFSGPDYSKKDPKKSPSTDHRSTLYWNANVLTDNNGKATLNFYTSNEQSTYSATIVGITDGGDIVSKRIQFRCQ
jgi:TonB-dependent Receptor Plug Domain